MNKELVSFMLSQVIDQIESVKNDVESGEFDENGSVAYALRIACAMNYLCDAWHFQNHSWEELTSLSQEEHMKYSYLIPKFHFEFTLQDNLTLEAK